MAPQIRPVPHNGHLVVYQGDSATLSCDILKGNPTPEITWKRKVRNIKYFRLCKELLCMLVTQGATILHNVNVNYNFHASIIVLCGIVVASGITSCSVNKY